MKRRIKQTNGYFTTGHGFEYSIKIIALHFLQLLEYLASVCLFIREYEIPENINPVLIKEHMLCSAQSYSFCPEIKSKGRITGTVSIGSDMEVLNKGSCQPDKFKQARALRIGLN